MKTMIVIGIIAVLVVVVYSAFMHKYKQETDKMTPSETQEITSGIYAIKTNYVNFYLIHDDGGYIAVDAGENREIAAEQMETVGIRPEDVKMVLLTHTHNDHIAALKLFENAVVYSPEHEKQIHPQHKVIKDSEKVHGENVEIECICTPGHTPGSVSYLINGSNLFVGDTLSLINGEVQLFNTFFNKNSDQQKESVSKVAQLDGIEYVFTSHYGYTNDFSYAFKQWEELQEKGN